jgi:hypothetical protein
MLTETQAGNGFANRFLWICCRRSKELPDGGTPDQSALRGLSEQLAGIISTAKNIQQITRDEAAAEAWRAIYHDLSASRPGMVGAIANRGEAQTVRLAMIYALLDQSPVIRIEHLEAGSAIWQYAEQSVEFLFGGRFGDPVVDAVLAALKGSPDGLSRTQLFAVFSRHKEVTQIDRALQQLQKLNLIYSATALTGGRPAEHWYAR